MCFSRDKQTSSPPTKFLSPPVAVAKPPLLSWSTRPLTLLPPSIIPKPGIVFPTSPSPSPFPRYDHALTTTSSPKGYLFLFGGLVDESAKNDLYVLSTSTNSTSLVQTTGKPPVPRSGHACALFGTTVIVWGGDTMEDPSTNFDNNLYLFDLERQEWTQLEVTGPSPEGRHGHTVTMVGPTFFVFGGQAAGRFLNDIWAIDLHSRIKTTSAWELFDPASQDRPAQRTGHVCITFEERIIVFGGTDGKYHYNDTWSFDLRTRRWTELQCIGFTPSPREGHAAALVGNVIYIFGGRDADGQNLGDVAAFQITHRRWYLFQDTGHSPGRRSGYAMASIGSEIFLVGGESFAGDDPNVIHVLDTKHIKFAEDKLDKRPLTVPSKIQQSHGALGGAAAPSGSAPLSGRAMFPSSCAPFGRSLNNDSGGGYQHQGFGNASAAGGLRQDPRKPPSGDPILMV